MHAHRNIHGIMHFLKKHALQHPVLGHRQGTRVHRVAVAPAGEETTFGGIGLQRDKGSRSVRATAQHRATQRIVGQCGNCKFLGISLYRAEIRPWGGRRISLIGDIGHMQRNVRCESSIE